MNTYKEYSPEEVLKIINDAYDYITMKNFSYMKNSKKPLDLNTIKSLYKGFYAGYNLLMKHKKNFDNKIINDLQSKKEIVDNQYAKNITYTNYNLVKFHKSAANKISSQSLEGIANNFEKLHLQKQNNNS